MIAGSAEIQQSGDGDLYRQIAYMFCLSLSRHDMTSAASKTKK